MGNWEDWWFVCKKCGERHRTGLKELDWDAVPFNHSAQDQNRNIEKGWTCDVCGSMEFQKDGRALPEGWDGVEKRKS